MTEKALQQWVIRLWIGGIAHFVCHRSLAMNGNDKKALPRTNRILAARVYELERSAHGGLTHLRKHHDIPPEWRIHVAQVFSKEGKFFVRDTVNENNNSNV